MTDVIFDGVEPPNPDLSPWNSFLDFVEECKSKGTEPTMHSYLIKTGQMKEFVRPTSAD